MIDMTSEERVEALTELAVAKRTDKEVLALILKRIGELVGRTFVLQARVGRGSWEGVTAQLGACIADEGDDNFAAMTDAGIGKIAADFAKCIPPSSTRCCRLALPFAVDACDEATDELVGLAIRRARAFDILESRWIHRLDMRFAEGNA